MLSASKLDLGKIQHSMFTIVLNNYLLSKSFTFEGLLILWMVQFCDQNFDTNPYEAFTTLELL